LYIIAPRSDVLKKRVRLEIGLLPLHAWVVSCEPILQFAVPEIERQRRLQPPAIHSAARVFFQRAAVLEHSRRRVRGKLIAPTVWDRRR
jgi:hypothetical protein